MTRKEFEARAIRAAERALHVPKGWWGTYRDVRGPGGLRVRFQGQSHWVLSVSGDVLSKHDSRAGAIRAARRL